MATTKFSMIFINEETGNILVNELSGEYTYKMATAIAKELCERSRDLLITVTETKKIFPSGENERVTKVDEIGWRVNTGKIK